MKTSKKFTVAAAIMSICLVLILLAYNILYTPPCDISAYNDQVFDKTYGININLYASYFASYSGGPAYRLTKDGFLYSAAAMYSAEPLAGPMKELELTEQNFDQIISGAGWTARGIDAQSAREANHSTWYAINEDGHLYYIMLQENGHVFLCSGQGSSTDSGDIFHHIDSIYYLRDLGRLEDMSK